MTDSDLETNLRQLLSQQADAVPGRSITAVVDRDYRPRTRSRAPLAAAGAVATIAIATGAVIALHTESPDHSVAPRDGLAASSLPSSPAPATTPYSGSPSMQLTGYRLTFPANYVVGQQNTNCTGQLHLDADEQSRLVTASPGTCPLLITSVLRALPPGTAKDEIPYLNADGSRSSDQSQALVFYHLAGPDGYFTAVYLPVRVPGDQDVYVTLDWGPDHHLNAGLLSDFEHGVNVEPLPPCTPTCTATSG